MSQKKAASSFINESSAGKNLMQFTSSWQQQFCHTKQSDINASSNSSQECKRNLIGGTVLTNDRSRAFAVSETGEKQLLDLEEIGIKNVKSEPSAVNSALKMEKVCQKSSHLSLQENESQCGSQMPLKKVKSAKRVSRQKYRPICLPRHVELLDTKNDKEKIKSREVSSDSRNSFTQTDNTCHLSPCCFKLPEYNRCTTPPYGYNMHLEGPRIIKTPALNTLTPPAVSLKPLKVHTKCNYNCSKYAELRNLMSAVTFITVVVWLILTYFRIESVWDCFDILGEYLTEWLTKKEKPKTRVELFVAFLQDLWS